MGQQSLNKMTHQQPIRLDTTQEDVQRKKALNEERNPRVTIPNEATQTVNPLTEREYEWDSTENGVYWNAGYDQTLSDRLFSKLKLKDEKNSEKLGGTYFIVPRKSSFSNLTDLFSDQEIQIPARVKPYEETSDYIEMQKKLGQMELRQRSDSAKTPFTRTDYNQFVDDLVTLAESFHESNVLKLNSIRDATGLDIALKGIEELREAQGNATLLKMKVGNFSKKKGQYINLEDSYGMPEMEDITERYGGGVSFN